MWQPEVHSGVLQDVWHDVLLRVPRGLQLCVQQFQGKSSLGNHAADSSRRARFIVVIHCALQVGTIMGLGICCVKVSHAPKFTDFTCPSTYMDKNKKVQLALSLKVCGDKVPCILKCR